VKICRDRWTLLLFPNAFGELPRQGAWRQLLATRLKKLTCSTLHKDGSPSQVSTRGKSKTTNSRMSGVGENGP
jgi:hypothetical protein